MDWRARLRQAIDATWKEDKVIAAEASIAKETLSRILSGEIQDPGVDTIIRLATATNVTVGWLLGEEAFSPSADQARLGEMIDYLKSKLRPSVTHTEPNAVPLPVPMTDPLANFSAEEALPAQATPGAEQDANAIPPRRTGLTSDERVRLPYRAKGDSMINVPIIDGDVLYLRRPYSRADAEGKIVVCRVDGSNYVKRFFYRNRRAELRSENPAYGTMIVDPTSQKLEIIGIVVRTVRDLSRQ